MHDAAAADGATHQARKQIARAAPAPVTGRLAGIAAGRKRALPSLYPLPQALIERIVREALLVLHAVARHRFTLKIVVFSG